MLFGDVETEKDAHSVSPADKISPYFPSIKIFRVFCQKEEDLLPLLHKMLDGLEMYDIYVCLFVCVYFLDPHATPGTTSNVADQCDCERDMGEQRFRTLVPIFER